MKILINIRWKRNSLIIEIHLAYERTYCAKPEFQIFFFNSFCSHAPVLRPGICTLCTIFGRMPGFKPQLLRLQPGVLPMSYTHPYFHDQWDFTDLTPLCCKGSIASSHYKANQVDETGVTSTIQIHLSTPWYKGYRTEPPSSAC